MLMEIIINLNCRISPAIEMKALRMSHHKIGLRIKKEFNTRTHNQEQNELVQCSAVYYIVYARVNG